MRGITSPSSYGATRLEAVEGGTLVTETFDYSKPWGIVLIPTGMPKKNQQGMVKTLERLADLVTATPEG